MYSAILACASPATGPVAAVDGARAGELVAQTRERVQVGFHRSTGRRDHGRAFAEDRVAGEERAHRFEVEDCVIERVARRVDRAQRDRAEVPIRFERQVGVVHDAAGRMRVDAGAGGGRQRGCSRRVIGMTVRERDARDPQAALRGRVDQRARMSLDRRPGIDHQRGGVAAVEQIGVRAAQRHRRGVGRANERYHASSSSGGIAKSSACGLGMIVSTGLLRAIFTASSTLTSALKRSRCLIVG